MNQQTIKMLKTGTFAGVIAAFIEIVIAAAVNKFLGANLDAVQLILGGLIIGVITMVLTVIISTVIVAGKQKI